ncbi:hypothetical protein CPB85DRAFT_142957 [Mucidula mucida]|nr:hypothetical protein CPB85DRAFT_142957 [Mucidula mucida]
MHWIVVLFAASGIATVHASAVLDVYHRVFHPDVGFGDFVPRGQVLLDSSPSFVSSSSMSDDFALFAQTLAEYSTDDRALYQVALESGGSWEYSSIKYCHLQLASVEDIILHTSLSEPFKPYAVDYFVSSVPHDGACPASNVTPTGFVNTTVTFQRPHLAPLPELRGISPVTSQTPGATGQPVEEKSFLQKYWIYIVAVTIALALSGGAPEEGGGPRRATA